MGQTGQSHAYATNLSSQQQKKLRGLAHALKPAVQLGGSGLTEGLLLAIQQAASTHELIKIQLPGGLGASEKAELCTSLLQALGPRIHMAGRIGRMLIVYLEKDPATAKLPLAQVKRRAENLH